jgi:hypothetical protein
MQNVKEQTNEKQMKNEKKILQFNNKNHKSSIIDKYQKIIQSKNENTKLVKESVLYILGFLVPGIFLITVHIILINQSGFINNSIVYRIFVELLKDLGGVLLAIGLISIGYEITVNRKLFDNISRLKHTIKDLQDTVSIASGAIDSGLTAVYTTREESKNAIREVLEELIADENNKEIEIKLLGISLGDYLCPHGGLHSIFRELIQLTKLKLSLLILEDKSQSALARASREEPHKFPQNIESQRLYENPEVLKAYESTRCHDELKTATDFIKDLLTRKEAQKESIDYVFAPSDSKKILADLYCATYDYSPMAFILILDEIMFVENYHLAGRGGEAPMLRISKHRESKRDKSTKLFNIYEQHYMVIKDNMSKKLKPELNTLHNQVDCPASEH